MEESSTYQAILRKGEIKGELNGEVKGLHKAALMVGEQRFGTPSARVRKRLNALTTSTEWDEVLLRIMQLNSWDEVFPPRRRS